MRKYNFIDLTGKKIGKFLILKEVDPIIRHYPSGKNKTLRWLCKCECGTEKIITGGNLRSGSIVSCGCYRRQIRKKVMQDYFTKKFPNSIENKYFSNYRLDAKRTNKKFCLTFEKFLKLIKENCYYCGSKPSLKIFNKTKTKFKFVNGIDRIDNKKGYIKNNIVPCCKQCNLMKNIWSKQEFLNHIEQIYFYQLANVDKNIRLNLTPSLYPEVKGRA